MPAGLQMDPAYSTDPWATRGNIARKKANIGIQVLNNSKHVIN